MTLLNTPGSDQSPVNATNWRPRDFLRLANLLSLSRVPLALGAVALMLRGGHLDGYAALGTMVLAGISDYLDGVFGRRLAGRGITNELGPILDPIADKIFAFIILGGLIATAKLDLWLAVMIVIRDLAIMAFSWKLSRGRVGVIQSNLPGKYYFAALVALACCAVVAFKAGVFLLTVATIVFWFWSVIAYTQRVFRLRSGIPEVVAVENPANSRIRTAAVLSFAVVVIVLFIQHLARDFGQY